MPGRLRSYVPNAGPQKRLCTDRLPPAANQPPEQNPWPLVDSGSKLFLRAAVYFGASSRWGSLPCGHCRLAPADCAGAFRAGSSRAGSLCAELSGDCAASALSVPATALQRPSVSRIHAHTARLSSGMHMEARHKAITRRARAASTRASA